jgi:hypothetical protein
LHILVDFFLPFFSYKLTVYWIAQPTFRRSLTPHFAVPHFNHLWKHSQTDSEMCFANFQGIIQSTSRFTITFWAKLARLRRPKINVLPHMRTLDLGQIQRCDRTWVTW